MLKIWKNWKNLRKFPQILSNLTRRFFQMETASFSDPLQHLATPGEIPSQIPSSKAEKAIAFTQAPHQENGRIVMRQCGAHRDDVSR
jgi:hypothetical protein